MAGLPGSCPSQCTQCLLPMCGVAPVQHPHPSERRLWCWHREKLWGAGEGAPFSPPAPGTTFSLVHVNLWGDWPHWSAPGYSWRLHPWCQQPGKPPCEGGEVAERRPYRDLVPALVLCVGKHLCMADRAPTGSQISVSGGCSQNRHTTTAWDSPASSFSTNPADAGQRGLLQER